MMKKEQINYLATKFQTNFTNLAREYVQSRFLSYFYQYEQAKNYYFKGGTALRLIYESPRFSEDLDFSSTVYTCREFEDLLEKVLVDLSREMINLDIEESKETTWGCLAVFSSKIYGEKFEIKTDVSLRRKKLEGERLVVKSPVAPPFNVLVLTKKQLVKEKIDALLTRSKPRDFFDLYYVLRARLEVLEVVPYKKKIIDLVNSSKDDALEELKDLLPKSFHSVISDFKQTLLGELRRL